MTGRGGDWGSLLVACEVWGGLPMVCDRAGPMAQGCVLLDFSPRTLA